MSRINFLVTILMMVLLLGAVFVYLKNSSYLSQNVLVTDNDEIEVVVTTTDGGNEAATSTDTAPVDRYVKPVQNDLGAGAQTKGVKFTGLLESVNTGCFADGECYVMVGGKHLTLLTGRYQGPLGKIVGADSIGDLEQRIGEIVSVYAEKLEEGYTLLGSDSYYLELATVSSGSDGVSGTSTKPVTGNGCMVGGCSGQICGEANQSDGMVSTCEWREQYACFKTAKCERQSTGRCGWTETDELKMCLLSNQ